MKVRTVGAVSVATMCAAAVGVFAPAHADLVTRCVGEGGAVTVPGDLVVPAGESCTLTGTTVEGDVRVGQDANLIADEATFNGQVAVAANGYVDTVGTSIADRVLLRSDGYGAYLDASDVGGNVVSQPSDEGSDGFIYGVDSSMAGNVTSRAGEIVVDGSEVSGNVVANEAFYADVYDSFVDGRLTVRATEAGSVVCGSAIQGVGVFDGNADILQVGSDGPAISCEAGSYWGSNVRVLDTEGDVYVDNNIINGNLVLQDNDPVANLGSSNLVRGNVIGEYDDYNAAGLMKQQNSPQAAPEAERAGDVQDRAEQRRDGAAQEAAASGKAF